MAASEPPALSPSAAANLTPVRYFTPDGLDEVAKLLKTIRTDKTLHRDEVEDLLDDPQYAKPLDPNGASVQHAIDRTRVFATKLELCEYFTSIFNNAFLETNRKNAGLWTWLALAYYSQFVKTKGSIVELTADARWIYDPEIYRLARRHFIIGKWFGLYEQLTGEKPKPIYSVVGVADFARNYGKAISFFFTVSKSFEDARERIRALYPRANNFDALYDFAYTAGDNPGCESNNLTFN